MKYVRIQYLLIFLPPLSKADQNNLLFDNLFVKLQSIHNINEHKNILEKIKSIEILKFENI